MLCYITREGILQSQNSMCTITLNTGAKKGTQTMQINCNVKGVSHDLRRLCDGVSYLKACLPGPGRKKRRKERERWCYSPPSAPLSVSAKRRIVCHLRDNRWLQRICSFAAVIFERHETRFRQPLKTHPSLSTCKYSLFKTSSTRVWQYM